MFIGRSEISDVKVVFFLEDGTIFLLSFRLKLFSCEWNTLVLLTGFQLSLELTFNRLSMRREKKLSSLSKI